MQGKENISDWPEKKKERRRKNPKESKLIGFMHSKLQFCHNIIKFDLILPLSLNSCFHFPMEIQQF